MNFDEDLIRIVTALSFAMIKQPNINGEQFISDFLEAIEGVSQSPENVSEIARELVKVMSVALKYK